MEDRKNFSVEEARSLMALCSDEYRVLARHSARSRLIYFLQKLQLRKNQPVNGSYDRTTTVCSENICSQCLHRTKGERKENGSPATEFLTKYQFSVLAASLPIRDRLPFASADLPLSFLLFFSLPFSLFLLVQRERNLERQSGPNSRANRESLVTVSRLKAWPGRVRLLSFTRTNRSQSNGCPGRNCMDFPNEMTFAKRLCMLDNPRYCYIIMTNLHGTLLG